MIELEKIELTSFMSYGPQTTTIQIGDLGECLITGEIIDENSDDTRPEFVSNGSGKSGLYNSILWLLFGRTMYAPRSGNQVINWDANECYVRGWLRNGDVITRTRKKNSDSELTIECDGNTILSTRSTNTNQQAELNRRYNLDWDIFCGASFFTQEGQPWLKMQEPQRKAAMERVFGIDRLSLRATIARARLGEITANQQLLVERLNQTKKSLESIENELAESKAAGERFYADRDRRSKDAAEKARDNLAKASAVAVPDIDSLKEKWSLLEQLQAKARTIKTQSDEINLGIADKKRAIRSNEATIQNWMDKGGKVCTECMQPIKQAHVHNQIKPYQDAAETLITETQALESKRGELDAKIAELRSTIAEHTPKMTLIEAQSIAGQKKQLIATARQWAESAQEISVEENPHDQTVARLTAKSGELATTIAELDGEISTADVHIKHLACIADAYADRKKVKRCSIAENIPFFNKRLDYYIKRMKLDLGIELTDSLTLKNTKWNYKFMSGGEKSRIDISYMLATFDVREMLYGRQSNVMVLDEVDSDTDGIGVDCLIDIIREDLAPRVETILVISRQAGMREAFPHHITVQREHRLSRIKEIR